MVALDVYAWLLDARTNASFFCDWISCNAFPSRHLGCFVPVGEPGQSLVPGSQMKTFSLRFKSEGQGTLQMESSVVIFLTSPKNAGALGQE